MADSEELTKLSAALAAKTGRDLAAWIDIARKAGIDGHMALVNHLKSTHAIGHGHANSIVHVANSSAAVVIDDSDLVAAMFDGPRGGWRPLYDQLVTQVQGFGDDVELAPKKGYVSLRRKKQFGLLQPSTKDRFDIGLALKGEEPGGKLELAGSWNAMVSHRVRIAAGEDAGADVTAWLHVAYDRAG